jgi:hypothetical protein
MDNRNLSYRKGWPQLPPLPVSDIRDGARKTVNDPQAVIDKVLELCQAHNTLVITADLSDDPVLASLMIQIRKYLQQDPQHQEISIEIIDDRAKNSLFSFIVRPNGDEDLIEHYISAQQMALEEIIKWKETFGTVEVLHRGLVNDRAQCPVTVVIASPTAANDIWVRDILPDIRGRFQALPPLVEVELLCGSWEYLASDEV